MFMSTIHTPADRATVTLALAHLRPVVTVTGETIDFAALPVGDTVIVTADGERVTFEHLGGGSGLFYWDAA